MKSLFVSAFYDINRENWKSCKRSNETYFEFFKFWAVLRVDLCVFCETQEIANKILSIRQEFGLLDRTKVVVLDIYSVEPAIYKKIQELASDTIQHDFHVRRSTPETHNAEYDYIMFMKTWLVKEAIQYAKKEYDIAAWIDFGFGHGNDTFSDSNEFDFEYSYKIDNHKINLFACKSVENLPIFDIIRTGDTYISGAFYVGPVDLWDKFWQEERRALLSLLDNGVIDDDQILLLMVARDNPKLVEINEIKIADDVFSFFVGLPFSSGRTIGFSEKVFFKPSLFWSFFNKLFWFKECFVYVIRTFKHIFSVKI